MWSSSVTTRLSHDPLRARIGDAAEAEQDRAPLQREVRIGVRDVDRAGLGPRRRVDEPPSRRAVGDVRDDVELLPRVRERELDAAVERRRDDQLVRGAALAQERRETGRAGGEPGPAPSDLPQSACSSSWSGPRPCIAATYCVTRPRAPVASAGHVEGLCEAARELRRAREPDAPERRARSAAPEGSRSPRRRPPARRRARRVPPPGAGSARAAPATPRPARSRAARRTRARVSRNACSASACRPLR